MFQYVVSFKGGERDLKKKKKSWGLGFGALFILAAQLLLVDLNLIHQRYQLVVLCLLFYSPFFLLLLLLMCKGRGRGCVERCSGRRGSLKRLKAALLATQETHSVSVGTLFVFVCAVRRAGGH